jgi:branched-chain amino acid transport system substrate-binding protein
MRKGKRTLVQLAALLSILMLVAAACGNGDDDDGATGTGNGTGTGGGGDGTLTLGYLLPQTGDLAILGEPMISGVELAVDQINAAGGVLDGDVELVGKDDGGRSNDDLAVQNAQELVTQESVDGIVGAAGSSTSQAVLETITGAGIPMCSPSNTGSDLSLEDSEDNGGFYFRTAPPDSLQAPALADVITGDAHDNVAIIALNDTYGQGFTRDLSTALEDAGATVAVQVAYDPQGQSYDADVQQIVDADPDAVAVIAFPDTGGRVLQAMIEQGVGPDDVQIYVTDGLQTNSLYEQVDPADPSVTEGIRGTAPAAAPEGGAEHFPADFEAFAPGVDTIFSAHTYDCTIVFALAALVAGSDDPADIQAEMIGVTKDGTKCTTFAECSQLVEDGDDIDYDGASGPLEFIDIGEPAAGTYDVYTFGADGTYATEETQITIG